MVSQSRNNIEQRTQINLYMLHCILRLCTGDTQKNGADSKVNKKLTSNLTWAQRTPSGAETVQVSAADGVLCARVK